MRKVLNYLLRPVGVELVKYEHVKLQGVHKIDTYAYALSSGRPSPLLIDVALLSAKGASEQLLPVNAPDLSDSKFFNIFPGEHYRLLAALARVTQSKIIVEVGTYTGMGSYAIFHNMDADAHLHTFDIVAWHSLPSHLSNEIFDSGKLTQHLSDLADRTAFSKYFELLNEADLIFCDGPKDGKFEYEFMKNLTALGPKKGRLLMLDDIRFKNMINLWTAIESPKLDITSFGHWSGTGLVDISDGLKCNI